MTRIAKTLRLLMDGGPLQTLEVAAAAGYTLRAAQTALTRLEKDGLAIRDRTGRHHTWRAAPNAKPIGERRGTMPGSQNALAASHRDPELRLQRIRNLRNAGLRFTPAGNYIPRPMPSKCALAECWRGPSFHRAIDEDQ